MVNDPEILKGFLFEATESLEEADNLLLQLEDRPEDLEMINAIFRPIHSLKGNSAFFGLDYITNLSHEMETLLDLMRKSELKVSSEIIEIVSHGMRYLEEIIDRLKNGGVEVEDEDQFKALLQQVIQAKTGQPLENATNPQDAVSVDLKKLKILVVEEGLKERNHLLEFLEEYGSLNVAISGEEAIEAVKSSMDLSKGYDLICLDKRVSDGHQVLTQIRKIEEEQNVPMTHHSKIVMTSFENNSENILSAFQEQADAYFFKPFDKENLKRQFTQAKLI